MIDLICKISPASSAFVNDLLHTLIFETVCAIAVPLIGILINAVIVSFLMQLLSHIITKKGAVFFSNYLLCPGVVIHELSHAFFALISGAKITKIVLFKPENGSLGYVEFRPRGTSFIRALQESLSACAPVVIGGILSLLIILRAYPATGALWLKIVLIYLLVSIVFHMEMSKPDLKCYFKGIWVLMLFALPFLLAFFCVFM